MNLRHILCLAALCILLAGGVNAAQAEESNPLYDFFPFGMYLVGHDPVTGIDGDLAKKADFTCADLKKRNFNCVWANNLDISAQLDSWLAACEKHGIRIIPQGGGLPDLLRLQKLPDLGFDNQEYIDNTVIPHWTALALKYRHSQALLAYSLEEECDPSPMSRYRLIDRVTRLMNGLDPRHPAIVTYNQVTSAELAADVVRPKAITSDWYPFWSDRESGPHTRAGSLSFYVVNQERAYRAARKSGGPFWIMAQGVSSDILVKGSSDKPMLRAPGPNEMRWQVWCSLYCGAKGIFFFYYSAGNFQRPQFSEDASDGDTIWWDRAMVDQLGRPSEYYLEAAQVSREIDPLKPLFLKLDWAEPDNNAIYWIESDYVLGRTFVHRDTGARYLVLFNSDPKEAHPAAVELNRFAKEVAEDTATYDVRARKMLSLAWPDKQMKNLMIGPGDGAVILILDKESTLAEHKALYEKD